MILNKHFLLFWASVLNPVSFGFLKLFFFFLNVENLFLKTWWIVLSQRVYAYLDGFPSKDIESCCLKWYRIKFKNISLLVVCSLVGKNSMKCSSFFLFNFFLDTCIDSIWKKISNQSGWKLQSCALSLILKDVESSQLNILTMEFILHAWKPRADSYQWWQLPFIKCSDALYVYFLLLFTSGCMEKDAITFAYEGPAALKHLSLFPRVV